MGATLDMVFDEGAPIREATVTILYEATMPMHAYLYLGLKL